MPNKPFFALAVGMNKRRSILLLLGALYVVLLTGCATQEALEPPGAHSFFVQGVTNWVDVRDLRKMADTFLRKRYREFDPAGAEVSVSVPHTNAPTFVMFRYYWNFGLPVYRVEFDRSWQVVGSKKFIATESVITNALPK